MFQSYNAPQDPVLGEARLMLLRKHMSAQSIDTVIVPHADEQRNEYLPANAERLAWLSGFTGSAGAAVVTADRAILFVDGRYTIQAAVQVDTKFIEVDDLIGHPPHIWISENMRANTVVGIDPWLHTDNEVKQYRTAADKAELKLEMLSSNLIDRIWQDQPAAPQEPVKIHEFEFAGKTTTDKLADLNATLETNTADLCVISDASSVCWLFNIRGSDVAHTPLCLAHAILRRDATPLLFIDKDRLDIEVYAFLNQVCEIQPATSMADKISELSDNARVMLDPNLTPHAIGELVRSAGGKIVPAQDPIVLPRAQKNQSEIEGSRSAHLRDGAAITSFLAWLDQQPPGSVDEIVTSKRLEQFRTDMAGNRPLREISFDTISGSGPNGAIVHYRVNEDTNRTLQSGELYLVDSGAQYDDGTTDITRTIAIGPAGRDERLTYTLVLKGHIGIALARFPAGTRGVDLDILARNALWQHGYDYAHGTGHGVGSYLSVHEGPQNISKRGMQEFLPGMIVSNEPGYYRQDAFGIRLENLVLVREPQDISQDGQAMLGFETLSLAPFDQNLIDPTILTDDELHWLNAYHGWVQRQLTPLLDEKTTLWLKQACEPMIRNLPAASA